MSVRDLVVVKVGTGVLTQADGRIDGGALVRLVAALAKLIGSGQRCVLISSGAVGAGVGELGLDAYPSEVAARQACASVGQAHLVHAYGNLFRHFDVRVAQILLTAADLRDGQRRGNVRRTLGTLLERPGVIPIINENDSVAVEELTFGDNDMLSVQVAGLIGARRLVLFTSVDGVMDAGGRLIEESGSAAELQGCVGEQTGPFSIGGMANKLRAVDAALEAGVEVVIANGRHPEQLSELLQGAGVGTHFRQSAR